MVWRKKVKKQKLDHQLLDDINRLKDEWKVMNSIIERSLEPSEDGIYDLSIAKAKYFYLLKEARLRNISARR